MVYMSYHTLPPFLPLLHYQQAAKRGLYDYPPPQYVVRRPFHAWNTFPGHEITQNYVLTLPGMSLLHFFNSSRIVAQLFFKSTLKRVLKSNKILMPHNTDIKKLC